MRRAFVVVPFILLCATSVAEEPDLARRISAAMPAGFSGPLVFGKEGKTSSHLWMRLRRDTTCTVSLIEGIGKTAEVEFDRPREASLFERLVHEAQSKYQVIHVDAPTSTDADRAGLQASWTGTKDWKDASEAWYSLHPRKGFATLTAYCAGTDSKDHLDSLRTALRIDELGE